MTLIEKIAAVFEKVGIKPAVSVPFLAGILLLVINTLVYGEPWDLDAARLLVGAFLVTALGIASPPAVGTRFDQINKH